MTLVNIDTKIINFLKGRSELSSIGDRYFYPDFRENKDENTPNPKVAIKQVGGHERGDYRYQIVVRADSIGTSRELAYIIANLLERNYLDDTTIFETIDGGINDIILQETNEVESFFYILFEDRMN